MRRSTKGFAIKLASGSGFCFGVRKALRMAEEAAAKPRASVYTYGAIIHNPQVVADLEAKGINKVSSLRRLKRGDALIISAHGSPPDVLQRARQRRLKVLDATCPIVARGHDYVRLLRRQGYRIIIIGDRDHREVAGLLARSAGSGRVVTAEKEVKQYRGRRAMRRVGVVCQTTQRPELLEKVTAALLSRAKEIRVFNTICDATRRRQDGALQLAAHVDVMLVVGGRNSANTQRLFEICRSTCSRSHLIEVADEIKEPWFSGARSVGVSGGASTPRRIIDSVMSRLRQISRKPRAPSGPKE